MRFLLTLLFALAMSVNAFAAATAQTGVCCASDECTLVQCLDMACAPVASPLATNHLAAFVPQAGMRALPVENDAELPNRYQEVWTPPD